MDLLTWKTFLPAISRSHPSVLKFGGTRDALVGYEPHAARLFLRLPLEEEPDDFLSPYAGIALDVVTIEGQRHLQVSTTLPERFEDSFRLLSLTAEIFEANPTSPVGAFREAAMRWDAVLVMKSLLSREAQIGLFGELLVLRGLVEQQGSGAIGCWTGRRTNLPDRHDFRLLQFDLEAKTTVRRNRVHTIHGLRQLATNPGRPLYLLSIQITGSAGPGCSIPSLVDEVRSALSPGSAARTQFDELLLGTGYRDESAGHYAGRWVLASEATLVRVDEDCPHILQSHLDTVLPAPTVGRIGEVSYEVNLDGLGMLPTSSGYVAVLGDLSVRTT